MNTYFGIDIGSSFLKGAVLDLDRPALPHTERVEFPGFVEGLPAGHREVDPHAIVSAVEDLLARLSTVSPRCGGVVFCGQMHGVILTDRAGEPVSNYISWLDERVSAAEFEELSGLVSEADRAATGNEFRPGLALSLLWWLKRHRMLPGGEAIPVSIADFVAARVTGSVPVMEPTQAGAFGALRLDRGEWHRGILAETGLDTLCWPEVRPSGSVAGYWRGSPCYTTAGDQQCALAGALLARGELSVNIGTGSQVALIADSSGQGGYQTRPYFDGTVLRTITHIPGGRHLSALVRMLTELGGAGQDAFEKIEPAVQAVPATDLRAHIAFFPGPCGERGLLENLHHGNMTAGHIFRAVFDSMARNYEMCARRLDPERSFDRAVFSGGVARRFPTLRTLTAERLRVPGRLSPHPEDTLFGLLVLALAFSGEAASVAEAQKRAADHCRIPAPDTSG